MRGEKKDIFKCLFVGEKKENWSVMNGCAKIGSRSATSDFLEY